MLRKEKEQDQDEDEEKSIHDQVQRVVLILLKNFSELFHDQAYCEAANYKK